MARRVLRALGLAVLAAPASADADATVLVQMHAHAWEAETMEVSAAEASVAEESMKEAGDQELWTVPGGLPDEPGYAFEKYKNMELVEGRNKRGEWVPVLISGRAGTGNLWNIHVSDEFPGYDLPNVPTELLRRPLGPGMSDYLVDNTWLRHKGHGINYRHDKTFNNKMAEYAPWGSLVVGTDEGDGWLKVHDGYLPMEIQGVPVLAKRERETNPVALPLGFIRFDENQKKEKAALAAGKDPIPPPPLKFETGEHVEFRTKQGDWWPALVQTKDWMFNDTYNVIVKVNEFSIYPVSHVHGSRLRKTGKVKRVPVPGEPVICKAEGCLLVRVRTENGKELLLNLGMRMKTEMLMKMACNKLKVKWEDCQARSQFAHNGEKLDGTLHLSESGLQDQDVVDMKLAPALSKEDDLINSLLNDV